MADDCAVVCVVDVHGGATDAVGVWLDDPPGLGAMKYGMIVATIANTANTNVPNAWTLLLRSNASITERMR